MPEGSLWVALGSVAWERMAEEGSIAVGTDTAPMESIPILAGIGDGIDTVEVAGTAGAETRMVGIAGIGGSGSEKAAEMRAATRNLLSL